jgi:hypothetical protein
MAAVDEVRLALERAVPDFSGRHGDWAAVLERARADRRSHRSWRKWALAPVAAAAAAAALVLFWPAGGGGENVLARARAAVGAGPVTHVVVRGAPVEVYDLERHEYRDLPVVEEEWFDPARESPPGRFHYVRTVGGRSVAEFLGGAAHVQFPEGVSQYAGIAAAYEHALAADKASLGAEETVQGRRVYWIRLDFDFGLRPGQYEVAVDAETFEPRFLRVERGPVVSVKFETLGPGEGDFTVGRFHPESSSWSGASRPGPLSPEEARDALKNALWLGERVGKVPLSSIREVRWATEVEALMEEPPTVRALELCYGTGEGCAVTMTEAAEANSMAAGGKGWPALRPPPGTLTFGDATGLGYVLRDGVWVTIQAPSRDQLIAAAEALKPIP